MQAMQGKIRWDVVILIAYTWVLGILLLLALTIMNGGTATEFKLGGYEQMPSLNQAVITDAAQNAAK